MGMWERVNGLDRRVFGDVPSQPAERRSAKVPLLIAVCLWVLAVIAGEVSGRVFGLPEWAALLIAVVGMGLGTLVALLLMTRRR